MENNFPILEINLVITEIICSFAKNNQKLMAQIFSIIQSLCRSAIAGDRELVLHQIERLCDVYKLSGDDKAAAALKSILSNAEKEQNILPSRLAISQALGGENLLPSTPIPVDKETSAPILEVIFPSDTIVSEPFFDEKIKDAVESVVIEWKNYSVLLKMNATPSRSCLIYGEPGTGKTHLAKWMAKEIQLPIVLAKLESIVSSFLGTSARNIGNLFKFANRYNCVLLLDEFDAIAKLRNDPQEVGEVKRIVNSLLQCLDERDSIGFTIGITNHEQLLDPAIWRRFDVQIDIPKPSNKVIQELLKAFLPPLVFSESELKLMSWCLNGATGADVEKWVNWLKRMKIINEYKHENLISLMKRYILLNTGRISKNVKDALDGPNETLYEILTGSDADLKKKDIASILNITPSSLSKQMSKFKNV